MSNDDSLSNYNLDNSLADFGLFFTSVCCGPPSSEPIQEYIKTFNLKHNTQFRRIEKVSPLGKEGEYMVLLYLDDWTENQKQKFYDGLQKIHWENEGETSFGSVIYYTNFKFDDILKNYQNFNVYPVELEDI